MRIGLNGITFAPGKMGGMETYFRSLVTNLQLIDRENEYLLLCDTCHEQEFAPLSPGFRFRHVNYADGSLRWFLRGALRAAFGTDILEREVKGLPVDLIHHPFTVLTPLKTALPSVLTFWDMQQEFYPEFFTARELRKRSSSYKASAQEATRIIVSSDFTRQCLVERYGIDQGKIDVIYTGYGEGFQQVMDQERLEKVQTVYGLQRPFIFYPAATWPHKNHVTLLAALKILIDRRLFDGELVLTGIAMAENGAVLQEIDRLGLTGSVRTLGYVSKNDLACLYSLARMLVFPSLFEGFGIPLVEAMACGCPVVCANATSLPEVVGDAGRLFDPRSAEDMAEQIELVWSNTELQAELRRRGLDRSGRFNWSDTARKTLDVYRKALA